jgi:hypothetical protein
MPTYQQLPGYLSLAFRRGDDFSATVDFNVNTTGFTWEAQIRSPVTGEAVQAVTVANTNPGAGIVTLSLTDQQTEALPEGTWSWTLVGEVSGVKRTYFSGFVEVVG